jgi:hypothetical protein
VQSAGNVFHVLRRITQRLFFRMRQDEINGSFVNSISISEPAFHWDGNYGSVPEVSCVAYFGERRPVKQ